MKGLENIYHKEVPGLYKNGELFLSFEELLRKDYAYVDKGIITTHYFSEFYLGRSGEEIEDFLDNEKKIFGEYYDYVFDDNCGHDYDDEEEEVDYGEIFDRNFANLALSGKLVLPDYVKIIGANAFCACNHLSEIVLPNSVEEIRIGAFASSAIQNIYLPEGLKRIEANAFYGDTIKEITLPDSLIFLDKSAFSRCKSLGKIIYGGKDVTAFLLRNNEKMKEKELETNNFKKLNKTKKFLEILHGDER